MRHAIRNFPHRVRGWRAELLRLAGVGILSELEAIHYSGPNTHHLGVISRRVVTNNGVAFIVDAHQNLVELEVLNYHDCGTGVVGEAAADSALGTPYGGARATGTQTEPAANQYRSTGTVSFTTTLAITEHGLFSATSAGTLFDRSVFAAINVVNGDSIQFTYTVTYTAGS